MKKVWLIIFLIFAAFLMVRPASANWLLTGQGDLFYSPSNKVLGKSTPTTSPGPKSSAPGQVKVKTHGRKALIENQGQNLTVQFLDQEDQVIEEDQEAEGTPGDEVSDQFTIEGDEGQDTVIRSNENASLVIRNKIVTQTHFPLMVNLETNELIVTTPKGQKIVTVLPDKAVENMLAANVLSQLGGKGGLKWLEYQASIATPSASPTATPSASPTATPSASPTATPSAQPSLSPAPAFQPAINLVLADDGSLVYEIDGYKNEKLLGLFNIALKRLVIVSAETGDLVSIEQDLLTRILDFLSF
jgi:hypothetical protein